MNIIKKLNNVPLKKELSLSIMIIATTLFLIGGFNLVSIRYAQASCEKVGGYIKSDAYNVKCVTKYTDGGNSCSTSLDCQGRCYVHSPDSGPTCEYNTYEGKCRGTISDYNRKCE